jgi:CHAD domain-containing protein
MLRRRRAAVLVGGVAARLLERAVGVAERVGQAISVAERAWASRHSVTEVLARRQTTEVTLVEPSPPASVERVTHDRAKDGAPQPLAWALARHLATEIEARSRLLDEEPLTIAERRVDALRRMRVATRRLRVLIDVFRPDLPPKPARRTRRALRRIGRALGPVRELDVHVQWLERCRDQTDAAEARVAIEHVLERVERRRARARARAREAIAATDWVRLRADLEEISNRVVGPLVRASVDERRWVRTRITPRIDQLFTKLAPHLEDTRPAGTSSTEIEALHELRIEAKCTRYAVDLARPVLDPRERELAKRLRLLQRVLGEHRDASLSVDLLPRVRLRLERRGRAALAAALGTVIEAAQARRTAAEATIAGALAKLGDSKSMPIL